MISEPLKQEALDFVQAVEEEAKEAARQESKAEIEKLKAEYDARIVSEREAYYNQGYADSDRDHQEAQAAAGAAQVHEAMVYADGVPYVNEMAKMVASFSYYRKFTGTKWGTLVLPISLEYPDWSGSFEIAEIVGVEVGSSGITAKRNVLGAGDKTVPNQPYLIRAKKADASKSQVIIKKNCLAFPSNPGEVVVQNSGRRYTFRGVYGKMSAADLAGKYYSSGGVFVPAKSTCNPMRVILEISE